MQDQPSFALTRPVHAGQVHLVVKDLAGLEGFYRKILGLTVLERAPSGAVLGVAGKPLLTLTTDHHAEPAPRHTAGLFHTAFLMPDRAHLAHWLVHAQRHGVALQGASDHLVSEALYLTDPEGNGIEIYRDRTPEEWSYHADGTIAMATRRLDLQALFDSASGSAYEGAPQGMAIGHIHLQVGDIAQAEAFYRDALGLKVMAHYPGASFLASGGYHHHLAANIWNSRGAGARRQNMTGLAGYSLVFNDRELLDKTIATLERSGIATERRADGVATKDPWGIGVTLSA